MKKFRFTLQTLYDIKSTEETDARNRLAALLKERDAVEGQINENDRVYASHNEAYRRDCKNGISGRRLREYGGYFEYLAAERKRLCALLKLCESQVHQCQQELLKLINEKKVQDRMREEQLAEYYKEVQKDEEKLIEDFMSADRR